MEKAKLTLEYLKALTWPMVVLITFLIFHKGINDFLYRLTRVDLPGGGSVSATGNISDDAIQDKIKGSAPYTWYGYRDIETSHNNCMERGKKALEKAKFKGIKVYETTVYGYENGYVGAVWCVEDRNMVFIIIAGPDSEVAKEKWRELNLYF